MLLQTANITFILPGAAHPTKAHRDVAPAALELPRATVALGPARRPLEPMGGRGSSRLVRFSACPEQIRLSCCGENPLRLARPAEPAVKSLRLCYNQIIMPETRAYAVCRRTTI